MQQEIVQYVVTKDGLVPANDKERLKYRRLLATMSAGDNVQALFEKVTDDAGFAQLSKLYACMRQIVNDTGNDLETVKREVKQRAGMSYRRGSTEISKSFGDCSKADLGIAINACIELGAELGCVIY